MPSPYPWHYSLRWPIYYRWPSTKRRVDLKKMPLKLLPKDAARKSLKIVFCGDIMVMQGDVIPTLHQEVCQFIASADALIGNCEAPLGYHQPNEKSRYGIKFYMSQDCLANIIEQTGLPPSKWYLSMANNHTGDMGLQAALDTDIIMQELHINPLGRWHKDSLPLTVFNLGPIRFGIIAWTDWMNCEVFSESDPVALRRKHIENINWQAVKQELNIDCLIALPHWEYEFQHFPHNSSQRFARSLFEKGLDILVGIHTHTLQPLERFGQGLCFYNIGNFCGLGVAWPVRMAPLLKMHIDAETGTIMGYELKIFAQVNSDKKVDILPLELISKTLRDKMTKRLELLFEEADRP
jgi:poly-gamma-glutamate synthesis protein (capsule biosynthesis protein)